MCNDEIDDAITNAKEKTMPLFNFSGLKNDIAPLSHDLQIPKLVYFISYIHITYLNKAFHNNS
jgi:hypothetical protein